MRVDFFWNDSSGYSTRAGPLDLLRASSSYAGHGGFFRHKQSSMTRMARREWPGVAALGLRSPSAGETQSGLLAVS